jgi:ParB-like chromosome segregation protein Spo0J
VGNVGAIADSLRVNGQYLPILVHRPTMNILAGTHTWMAARMLGWDSITAVFTDVDERKAKAIMLVDNRAADAGWTDETLAMDILMTLPDIDGTGYTHDDLKLPPIDEDWPDPEPIGHGDAQSSSGAPKNAQNDVEPFDVGAARGYVEKYEYDRWRSSLPKPPGEASAVLMGKLGLGIEPSTQPSSHDGEAWVPISSLNPYPGNPRQGDIGLIATSLKAHGQTRPIVASRTTRHILRGNSTADAALQLGWATIWVTWVDVDDVGEKKIVLADNRTSDLASYDKDVLARAIAEAVNGPDQIMETGYTLEELDDIAAGKSLKETPRTGGTRVRIGKVSFKTSYQSLAGLGLTPGRVLQEVAERVGINPARVMGAENRTNGWLT